MIEAGCYQELKELAVHIRKVDHIVIKVVIQQSLGLRNKEEDNE